MTDKELATAVTRCGVCGRAAGMGHEMTCSYGFPESGGVKLGKREAEYVKTIVDAAAKGTVSVDGMKVIG